MICKGREELRHVLRRVARFVAVPACSFHKQFINNPLRHSHRDWFPVFRVLKFPPSSHLIGPVGLRQRPTNGVHIAFADTDDVRQVLRIGVRIAGKE